MTDKQTIIDGIDVSKCEYFLNESGYIPETGEFIDGACEAIAAHDGYGEFMYYGVCKSVNCYFKRAEKEIDENRKLIEKLEEEIACLKTENERYKRYEPLLSRLLEHCNIPDKEKSISPIDYVNNLINENEKLKIKLMQQDEVNTFFNTPIEGWNNDPCGICEHKQNYTQLKTENEELKKKVSYYEKDRVESHKTNVHNLVLIKRYKQPLDEIYLIIDELKQSYDYMSAYSEIDEILDIINKTKDGK